VDILLLIREGKRKKGTMKSHQLLTSTLVLVLCFWVSTAQLLDYSPCYYTPSYDNDNTGQIVCDSQPASEVLDAFRRNKNNTKIDVLFLWSLDDMTTNKLAKIVDIVAASAGQSVWRIEIENLQRVKKMPQSLQKFTDLQHLNFKRIGGLETLPYGSVASSSDTLFHIYCDHNSNLKAISPGAFQGNFNTTTIHLSDNNLHHFEEAVFKPLMSDSAAKIEINGNPIKCHSCKLAWIIRDNRQFLSRVTGDCTDINGSRINFDDVDPITLKHC